VSDSLGSWAGGAGWRTEARVIPAGLRGGMCPGFQSCKDSLKPGMLFVRHSVRPGESGIPR
jgi:hypothetical protein